MQPKNRGAEYQHTSHPPRSVNMRRAYLLRCWQEPVSERDGGPVWRLSLARVGHDAEERRFASLTLLFAYLASDLAEDDDMGDGQIRDADKTTAMLAARGTRESPQ